MKITQSYARAVNATSLTSVTRPGVDESATVSNTDALGAFGLADKHLTAGRRVIDREGNTEPVRPAPLAVSLERLFSGDGRAAHDIVRKLADMVYERSWVVKVKIGRATAAEMACACLAWHRNGTCQPCGGHGVTLIPGTRTKGEHDCQACRGTGKVPFEQNFRHEHKELARWLVTEIEREAGRAGPAAMRALADSMKL